MSKASSHMYRWFHTPVGRRMLEQESELIEQCRKEYKGSTMLQVTSSGKAFLGKASNKRLKITVSSSASSKKNDRLENYCWLAADLDALPLEDGSVDFMVLHHSLEFSENPHAMLRESVRVLSPQGHLVVICFNPYSLFGLRKSMQFIFSNSIPWAHHGLSRARISDWLKLMNCDAMNAAWGFYGFPVQSEVLLRYSAKVDHFLTNNGVPGGGFFVIHASKEVAGWIGSVSTQPQRARLVRFPAAVATKQLSNVERNKLDTQV